MAKNLLNEYVEDLAADAANGEANGRNRKCGYMPRRGRNHTAAEENTGFLGALKTAANLTRTENGAVTLRSSGSYVLDLFACAGALRHMDDCEILRRFYRAWAEDRDLALKILFYARDVRGGLGERRVFRSVLRALAQQEPDSIRRNIALIPEYGRYDDLLELLGTSCERDVLDLIRNELKKDKAAMEAGEPVSLAAKWLPSINASSEKTRQLAAAVAGGIGMNKAEYRKTLSALRGAEKLLENRLRERDYRFSYSAQPSKAMLKYRRAFRCNDGKRYDAYLDQVMSGKAGMHTSGIMPYELVRKAMGSKFQMSPIFVSWNCYQENAIDPAERKSLDVMWNALEDFTDGRNALAVIDGSGSMYGGGDPLPVEVAISLGMYFAERNSGMFRNHFITFSMHPQLVEIKGEDFVDRVRYCETFNECANTDIQAVFKLILDTAVKNRLPQSELPETLYIISDMEFDSCARNADKTNFEYAKWLYESCGYRLPNLVFWNVQSRHQQVPVRKNDRGVALVSGASARIFSMVMKNEMDPYTFMMKVIGSERYAPIRA